MPSLPALPLLTPGLTLLIPGLTRDLLARRSTPWTFRTTEGIPGSHPYYRLFLRTNPGLRPSHPYFRLILRTRLGSDPSLLPSPLKHTHHVLDYLQCIPPCFNHPFHPRLKHTYPVLDYLQCITPCFNHPFHFRLCVPGTD